MSPPSNPQSPRVPVVIAFHDTRREKIVSLLGVIPVLIPDVEDEALEQLDAESAQVGLGAGRSR